MFKTTNMYYITSYVSSHILSWDFLVIMIYTHNAYTKNIKRILKMKINEIF